jgi:hypothetical protein
LTDEYRKRGRSRYPLDQRVPGCGLDSIPECHAQLGQCTIVRQGRCVFKVDSRTHRLVRQSPPRFPG